MMMKFIASTLEAAKAKAQRAYGDKTVIIGVRTLPSGDVEVSASDKPAPAAPLASAHRLEPTFGEEARRIIDEAPSRAPSGARLSEAMEHRFAEDALAKLRGDLTRGGSGKGASRIDLSDRSISAMAELLTPHGVGEDLLAAVIAGSRAARLNEDFHRLEAGFAAAFAYAPFEASAAAPIMLVGPTGAGKTSCTAKLAAAAIARAGSALILTADVGRAGAVDQLRTYGDTLGADYDTVETPHDVEAALRRRRPQGGVIFDTPGVSPFDTSDLAALKSFQEACEAEAVLVLPASGDAAEFRDWALAFREFGVRRAVITKFDAAKRVGAAVNAAYAARLALSYFSETAFISEGLLEASPEFLARRLIASRPGRIG